MAQETQLAPEVRSRYEAVIGLEVHVQLLTRSKIFCSCSTRFGDPPNSHVCAVCLGLPGALPVLNREAVSMAVKAALALNCAVNPQSRFARKNYFYPDLPKGYQISQYDEPLAEHGWLEIDSGEQMRRIHITRVHLEEDAGKSLHEGFADSEEKSYIDLNRAGVPLIEIVSEPDLRSPEEAYEYLTQLKTVILYLGVSDCNMEEGSLRVDANVSVRPSGAEKLGTKTEVKNLNSFRYLQKALAYEVERQIVVLEAGGGIEQETRLWDSRAQKTLGMRSKEFAHDYRYFPEPDLLPLAVPEVWREEVRRTIPELPRAKEARFESECALPKQDAKLLAASPATANFFEAAAKLSGEPKSSANWILNDLAFLLQEMGKSLEDSPVSADQLAELIVLYRDGKISSKIGKEILRTMARTGKRAADIIAEQGIEQISDSGKIVAVVRDVITANPRQAEQFRSGKTATLGWFVGQVMKATNGQANPQKVREVLEKELAPR